MSRTGALITRVMCAGMQVGVVFGIGFVSWLPSKSIYELIALFVHVSAYIA